MDSGTEDFAHTRAAGSRSRERNSLPVSDGGDWVQCLAQIAPIGIIRADSQGRYIYANARWCEMTGYPAETALGIGWDRVVHPEEAVWLRHLDRQPATFGELCGELAAGRSDEEAAARAFELLARCTADCLLRADA